MDTFLTILLIWILRIIVIRCCYFAITQHRWRAAAFWGVGILWPLPFIVSYWLRRWYLKSKHRRQQCESISTS